MFSLFLGTKLRLLIFDFLGWVLFLERRKNGAGTGNTDWTDRTDKTRIRL